MRKEIPLDELRHYGVRGMKWNSRKAVVTDQARPGGTHVTPKPTATPKMPPVGDHIRPASKPAGSLTVQDVGVHPPKISKPDKATKKKIDTGHKWLGIALTSSFTKKYVAPKNTHK